MTQPLMDYRAVDIVSENPIQDTWRLLRRYLDLSFTERHHKVMFMFQPFENGIDRDALMKQLNNNAAKQARQIAYCIRQAQEYFKAASNVSLATRPTLIYYGVMSLSQAMTMMRGGGDMSLDFLRNKAEEHTHGLRITNSVFDKKRHLMPIVEYFSTLRCEPHRKLLEDGSVKMVGTFVNFYNHVGYEYVTHRVTFDERYKEIQRQESHAFLSGKNPELAALENYKFNCLDLLCTLPDIYSLSNTLGIHALATKTARLYFQARYSINPPSNSSRAYIQFVAHYFVNTIKPETLERWTLQFQKLVDEDFQAYLDARERANGRPFTDEEKALVIKEVQDFHNLQVASTPGTTRIDWSTKVETENHHSDHRQVMDLPSLLTGKLLFQASEDIFGGYHIVLDPQNCFTELVSLYVLSYCLGMLSRYAPDLWIKTVDENVEVAEFVESLLNLIARKYPVLILDQLSGRKHRIRTVMS